jgi:hypothetical protein
MQVFSLFVHALIVVGVIKSEVNLSSRYCCQIIPVVIPNFIGSVEL